MCTFFGGYFTNYIGTLTEHVALLLLNIWIDFVTSSASNGSLVDQRIWILFGDSHYGNGH